MPTHLASRSRLWVVCVATTSAVVAAGVGWSGSAASARPVAERLASAPTAASATKSSSAGISQAEVARSVMVRNRVSRSALREAQLAARVEQMAVARARALVALDALVEKYAAEQVAEAARLAALGYAGNLRDLTHILPLTGYRISAGFGQAGGLWRTVHTGLDFAAPVGTPLVAITDATVTSVGDAGAYGLRTVLTLKDGTQLWYCHQVATVVKVGDKVVTGQPIGAVGSTGNTTGPHLHLEVRPEPGQPIDPRGWLAALGLQV